MIILQQEQFNLGLATCSRNKNLSTPTYLWSIRHKLSNQSWKFIPKRVESDLSYKAPYDLFEIAIYGGQPENYIYSGDNYVNLHLIEGEYYLKIYEQVSTTNLDPTLTYDTVYEGLLIVKTDTPTEEIKYSGSSDVFIIYNS